MTGLWKHGHVVQAGHVEEPQCRSLALRGPKLTWDLELEQIDAGQHSRLMVGNWRTRAMQVRNLGVLTAIAFGIGLASCSQEVEYSDQQRACIARRYTNFDAKDLGQCVDVCKSCMKGNTVTCNTSCRLKGAS